MCSWSFRFLRSSSKELWSSVIPAAKHVLALTSSRFMKSDQASAASFPCSRTVKVFNEISHKQFICGQLPDVAVATDVVVGRAVFHSPWHGDKSSQLGGQAAHLICWSNVHADGKGRDNNICAHIFSQTMKDLRTKRDS